jgi:TM2 domain-containing membrane protein YozV
MEKIQVSKEKKLTLLLLCWIFGLFGVHRFYTGKYISGSLQLLGVVLIGMLAVFEVKSMLSIPLFILPLWWIVDVMRIIMGKFTDKEGKPITDWV